MVRAKPTAATVSDPNITLVLIRGGITLMSEHQVVAMLEDPNATFKSVALELGIAPSALHRFVTACGYKRYGKHEYRRADGSSN